MEISVIIWTVLAYNAALLIESNSQLNIMLPKPLKIITILIWGVSFDSTIVSYLVADWIQKQINKANNIGYKNA